LRSLRKTHAISTRADVDGRLVAHPIEDEANVDARRAEVGLMPMAGYAKQLAEGYKLPVEWPRVSK
jgi:hypothetical protein